MQPERTALTPEAVADRIRSAVAGARIELVPNPAVPEQSSLRLDRAHAPAAAVFLRDTPGLQFDFASNVTGVDWLDSVVKEKVKVRRLEEGVERDFEDFIEIKRPGRLEVVYHLYSMALRHGPLVIRVQTEDRSGRVHVPSLTPVWRSCELQEREVYDLYGVVFDGHPDLRRILMWDGFVDHPMRKDYMEPDDFEYEPTAHGDVLERARRQGAGGRRP